MNTAGVTKKKATTAFVFIGQTLGSILGPFLFTSSLGEPVRPRGFLVGATAYSVITWLVVVTGGHLRTLNAGHSRRRGTRDEKADTKPSPNARVDSALDIEYMQTPAGIYRLEDKDLDMPYIFKDRVYEDLTDQEDEEFFFSL